MASLESVEKLKYIKPKQSVLDVDGEKVLLKKEDIHFETDNYTLSLDGIWKLDGYDAKVPGSIHTAMFEAGVIPDPYKYRNDDIAREMSFRDWYYTKEFNYTGNGKDVFLVFGGVADRCDVYLNDVHLGFHQGMFAPFEFDVSDYIVNGLNSLKVHLYPAIDFNNTVVFNCSYGWHYARIWPLGIWENVKIEDRPKVYFDHPFITTKSHLSGTMELLLTLVGENINGTIVGTIKGDNLKGNNSFKYDISDRNSVKLTFDIPDFKLWWPNGFGEQNLYNLDLYYIENDIVVSNVSTTFGIRTLSMEPFPSGEKEDTYNRTCVINGRGIFMKGAGWCTIDALMRFDIKDYDRILSRAKQQGINFLRAWGGGLVETDEFYSLCDKYGICVYQEWPCCWDSQKVQPAELLYETVITQTKRIRNRPSLVLYGGGNEGHGAFEDEVLNRIGAYTYEYDGTRIFYRQDGGVSSKGMTHDHIHWGGETPEHYIVRYGNVKEVNMHEYGLDSLMNLDSILKYADFDDIIEWPIAPKGVIAHHTATFNGEYGWNPTPHGYDIDTFIHYSNMFLEPTELKDVILGSQLAQAMAKYPTLINSRIKWPYCTNAVYYKLNDVYPGASWSTVDWYGAPKLAHYLCQDAYMPLMACGLFDRYNTYDKDKKDLTVPVYVLDDNKVLLGKEYIVDVKAYGSNLDCIKSISFNKVGESTNCYLGDFVLNEKESSSVPLIITFTLYVDKNNVSRTYMYLNFDKIPGSLMNLPETILKWNKSDNVIEVMNIGDKPAVSVNVLCENADEFVCSDNFFFLESGESKVIEVSDVSMVKGFTCFNAKKEMFDNVNISLNIKAKALSHDSIIVSWDKVNNINGYAVFLNGKKIAGVKYSSNCEYVISDLDENTEYIASLGVYIGHELRLCNDNLRIKTLHDSTKPDVISAYFSHSDSITILFSKDIVADSNSFYIDNVKIKSILMDGKKVKLKLNKEVPVDTGVILQLNDIHDNTYLKNRLEKTEINVKSMLIRCGSYKYGEGTVVIKDSDFSIKDKAVISMRIKPDNLDGQYQVFFARAPKGGENHFEFYISPTSELKMYSAKGDHYLGVNLKEHEGKWCDFSVEMDGLSVKVFFNKKITYSDIDRLGAEDGYFDISLGSLLDNTLVFKGELDDVCLYRGIL